MEQLNKIQALEYLVDNEVHTSEWKGAAMYIRCRKIIKSDKQYFNICELDKIIEEIKNS